MSCSQSGGELGIEEHDPVTITRGVCSCVYILCIFALSYS